MTGRAKKRSNLPLSDSHSDDIRRVLRKERIITTMDRVDDNEYIYLSLLHLGAVGWNKSSRRLLFTLQYVISHDLVTMSPVKYLYANIAAAQNCSYGVIERSLRYAIQCLWECSRVECSKLLYHSSEVSRCPSVSEFIFLYTKAFKRGIIQAWVNSLEADAEKTAATDVQEMFELLKI